MIDLMITIVITLLIVGVLVWGIKALPIIDGTYKQFAIVAIVVCSAIWLLYQVVPLLHHIPR